MKEKDENFLHQAAETTLTLLVTAWVLNFLLSTRLGGFLLLTFISGFGSLLLIAGVINGVFDSDYAAYEHWWIHLLCWGGGALHSIYHMNKYHLWDSPEESLARLEEEVDGN